MTPPISATTHAAGSGIPSHSTSPIAASPLAATMITVRNQAPAEHGITKNLDFEKADHILSLRPPGLSNGGQSPTKVPAVVTVDRQGWTKATALDPATGRINPSELNGKATFPGTDAKIVCRHIALAWLRNRLAHDRCKSDTPAQATISSNKQKMVERTIDCFGSPERLAANVLPFYDEASEALSLTAPAWEVTNAHWGQMFASQLREMATGQSKYYLASTQNHAMALMLKVKQVAGLPNYVVELYDPTRTTTHFRTAKETLKEVEGMTARDFITSAGRQLYYSYTEPDGCVQRHQLTHILRITAEDLDALHDLKLTPDIDQRPLVIHGTSLKHALDANLLINRFFHKLPISDLESYTAQCTTSEQARRLLGMDELQFGSQIQSELIRLNQVEQIKSFVAAVSLAQKKGLVSNDECTKLWMTPFDEDIPQGPGLDAFTKLLPKEVLLQARSRLP